MKAWYDLGPISYSFTKDFQDFANEILLPTGLQGSFANLITMEPGHGSWGDIRHDLPVRYAEQLESSVMPQSGFRLGGDTYLESVETEGFPEIYRAIVNKKARFLVGTLPDGIRVVAIFLLD